MTLQALGWTAALITIVIVRSGIYYISEKSLGGHLRLGRFKRFLAPGLHWTMPFVDDVLVLDAIEERFPEWKSLSLNDQWQVFEQEYKRELNQACDDILGFRGKREEEKTESE